MVKLSITAMALVVMLGAQTQSQTPGIQLEERSFLDNKVSILLPKQFELMGTEMLKFKYPSERRPTLVYTDEDGTVNVALNHTSDRATLSQLPELHKVIEATFKKSFPSATWFRSEVSEINGRRCILLDLRTRGIDTEIRNLILGTSLDGRVLLVTFNSTRELENLWVPVGNKIINSVRVRE